MDNIVLVHHIELQKKKKTHGEICNAWKKSLGLLQICLNSADIKQATINYKVFCIVYSYGEKKNRRRKVNFH